MSDSSSISSNFDALDTLTGGAFSASTASERAARIRTWLERDPSTEQMQEVFKELSHKDKGAAKAVRERLDEIKRNKNQASTAQEWADKAAQLLALKKINIADAMAWQRDAAKAGASLSREPLLNLKTQLADRVKCIEDLQYQTQVLRESAIMLAQRIELFSTKPLNEAYSAQSDLDADVQNWSVQSQSLLQHADWVSVDGKFPVQMESARQQLHIVSDAYRAAIESARTAQSDPQAHLPPVPVWAEEIRSSRAASSEEKSLENASAGKPKIDPAARAQAIEAVRKSLGTLEQELEQGHGKASLSAANAVRNALREHGKLIDAKTDFAANTALSAAAELEGWQRWRANQIRESLIVQAKELLQNPLAPRKQQELIRQLREQWKQSDQGGMANNALWKIFDLTCNEAHKLVEAWVEKNKAQESETKTQRLALIAEVETWTNAAANRHDWKIIARELHQFSERWRSGGHVSEKLFDQLQPQWKQAIKAAQAPLDAAQKNSQAQRQLLIEEAKALSAQDSLRIDAVRALQQRWQQEAQTLSLDRRLEQKLWDAFRQPIDAAFARKDQARTAAQASVSAHDERVLAAVSALDAASASGDALAIRSAMRALDDTLRGQTPTVQAAETAIETAPAATTTETPSETPSETPTETPTEAIAEAIAEATVETIVDTVADSTAESQTENIADAAVENATETAAAPPAETTSKPPPAAPKKPLIAMRGDDRPGAKKTTPEANTSKGGKFPSKFGDKSTGKFGDAPRRDNRDGRDGRDNRNDRTGARTDEMRSPLPRLSNQAFFAQKQAQERAEFALKKLASQAHGDALGKIIDAWKNRQGDALPTTQEMGKAVSNALRQQWQKHLAQNASNQDSSNTLLRLEIAADIPTPAAHLIARRSFQLQLLTQKHGKTPQESWGEDIATVLASAYQEESGKRLQSALLKLLRK